MLYSPSTYFQHEIFHRLVRPDVDLPDRIHARMLVEIAIRFIGTDFFLVLKKTFYTKLDLICGGEELRYPQDVAWVCKLYALLALGEMYSNRKRRMPTQSVPGTEYFLRAVGLLEDRYEDASLENVEVMILFVRASQVCCSLERRF